MILSPFPNATTADARSEEERRFARADKDEDRKITLAELVEPGRKPFAKLDHGGDGKLSLEKWAVKTIDKFETANANKSKALTPAEYATPAPTPKKTKPAWSCG